MLSACAAAPLRLAAPSLFSRHANAFYRRLRDDQKRDTL